jgi:hypothetical protein
MLRRTTGVACGVLGAGLLVCSLAGCSLIFPFSTTPPEDDRGLGDAAAPADVSFSEGGGITDAVPPTDIDGGPTSDTSKPPQDSGLCSLSSSKTGWNLMQGPTEVRKLYGIWGQSLHELWAVGEKLTLLRVDPKTCTWVVWDIETDLGSTLYNKLSGFTLWGIWGSSAGNVFAVGEQGTILHFNGTKWSQEPSGITQVLRAVGGSASHVFAVGYGAKLLHRVAKGVWKGWTPGIGVGNALMGISGKVPGTTPGGTWAYYAVGVNSFVYHDGAASTTFSDVAGWKSSCWSANNWQAVWGAPAPVVNKPEVVLVGQGGAVQRFFRASSGAAPSCTQETVGTADLQAVDARDTDDIWIVGDAGGVHQRKGGLWSPRSLPKPNNSAPLRGVWVAKSGANRVIVVSETKTIFYRYY